MEVEKMTYTIWKLVLHRVNVGICTTQNMEWKHASQLNLSEEQSALISQSVRTCQNPIILWVHIK